MTTMTKVSQNLLMQNQLNPVLAAPKTKIEYQGKTKILKFPKPVILYQSPYNLKLELSPISYYGKDNANFLVNKIIELDSVKKDDNHGEKLKVIENLQKKKKILYQEHSKKLLKDIDNSNFLPVLINESVQQEEKDKKILIASSADYELEKEKDTTVYFSSIQSLYAK